MFGKGGGIYHHAIHGRHSLYTTIVYYRCILPVYTTCIISFDLLKHIDTFLSFSLSSIPSLETTRPKIFIASPPKLFGMFGAGVNHLPTCPSSHLLASSFLAFMHRITHSIASQRSSSHRIIASFGTMKIRGGSRLANEFLFRILIIRTFEMRQMIYFDVSTGSRLTASPGVLVIAM